MISRTPKVLIVEDEMIVLWHLDHIVCGLGHEVTGLAVNAEEAYRAAEAERPDVVLMDVRLADGSDGVEAANVLRERYGCAVVFLSASADPRVRVPAGSEARQEEVCVREEASAYVPKPFSGDDIRRAIVAVLGDSGRPRPAWDRSRAMDVLLDTVDHPVILADMLGCICYQNPAAIRLMGHGTDARGLPLGALLAFACDRDAAAFKRAMADACRGVKGGLEQLNLVDGDGTERLLQVSLDPLIVDGGGVSSVAVSFKDCTLLPAQGTVVPTRRRRPFGEETRLLVYSPESAGLGHLRRSVALIEQMATDHVGLSALLVSDSARVHQQRLPPRTDSLKLPALPGGAQNQGHHSNGAQSTNDGIRAGRTELLLRTVREYRPDVLLADQFATGMGGELLPALEWLRKDGHCTRVLGIRGIFDEPERVVDRWRTTGVYERIEEHYDHVVVYGVEGVYDTVQEYAFPERIAARTRYLHYVCAATDRSNRDPRILASGSDRQPLVVVATGDGGAESMIRDYLEMLKRYRGDIDFQTEMLIGSVHAPDVERAFRSLAEELPVNIRNFAPSKRLFQRADLVVSTAGYGSTVDILSHARRAILVPGDGHRSEQLIRARRMDQLGLVRHLNPDGVTPELLVQVVSGMLDSADEPLRLARHKGTVPLDGIARFSRFCGSLEVGNIESRLALS